MSDDPEQPKRNLFEKVEHKFQDKLHKAKDNFRRVFSHSPTPSEQPTRSTTPVPNQQASSLSATAINPESTPSRVDNGGNSPKGGDTVKTDTSGTAPSELDINPYLEFTHILPDFDWQAWNIDGDAISELRVWGAGHENSNWRKLADKIDQSLKSETVKAVQDFIPDSPFPAKTLVKALLSIVQLGIVCCLSQFGLIPVS
ncbi:hypothetical protein B0H16DRAFT_238326 [Mycena metata]|uniref:Uncharacterized protein n=1 Tax=Mycena metata TaxID=1033252 RepID=A0AAD7NPT7_9AGAR|nr:hypothetical protein B0H16DRAFT_238326 [Mycena metata]